jgi:pilus assembly protein CpaC
LAEPTLMTLSGRSASFNAGGEIPYQGSSSSNSLGGTSPQIEFKQYGIQLSFTPTVMGDSIHLDLKTEVSDPDDSLKLQANGVAIPAIRKKDAQTTVVLGDGQSLMIAGLLYNKRSSTSKRFPGLSDIPIVGAAFSNESNDDEERELVIVVTPHRVQPINPSQPVAVLPADHKTISAYDAFFFSKRNLSNRKPLSSTFKAGLVY